MRNDERGSRCDDGGLVPEEVERILLAYERFLWAECGRSPHTRRAYLGDVRDLLAHARRVGAQAPADLTLTILRDWLAAMTATGLARATVARRAASARSFTGWLHRTGRSPVDVGIRLGSPRAARTLPGVLR